MRPLPPDSGSPAFLPCTELTGPRVPDAANEAVRDLIRAREAAAEDRRRKHQQLLSFLLRHGQVYGGGDHWTLAHGRWLAKQELRASR
jgi:transposase